MEWNEELEVELATHLSGNINLYNSVVEVIKKQQLDSTEWQGKYQETHQKLEKANELDVQKNMQIANLVNRLPMFSSEGEKKKELTTESIIDSINNMELEGL